MTLNSSFLAVWGASLGMPLTILNNKRKSRYVLILWVYASYILNCSFQANLMKSFVTSKYKRSIKTLEDLKESGLKIGLIDYYSNNSTATKDLCVKENYVPMSEGEIVARIMKEDVSHAYFLGKDLAEYLLDKHDKSHKERSFEVMPQVILPAFTVYHLHKQSFLTAKLDRFILILHASGLMERGNRWKKNVIEKEKVLRMSHLFAAFKLLLFGYISSLLVLVFEVIIWKYIKDKDGHFEGFDKTVFELFAYFLNASLEIGISGNITDTDPTLKIVEWINRGEMDIMGNRILQILHFKDMDYSFPMSREDKYFIVPKRKVPSDLLIIYAFTETVWATLLVTIAILTAVMHIMYKKSLISSFFAVWGVFLGVPLTILDNKPKLRYVVILWVYASYILSCSFQANLLRSFVATRYQKSIKTLEDLKESGLKIGMTPFYTNTSNATKDLIVKENYVPMLENETVARILRDDSNYAYFSGKGFVEHLFDKRDKSCEASLEIMPEAILPGFTVYHLHKRSYLTAKLDRFILILHSSGLMERRNTLTKNIIEKEKVLKMSHLFAAFKLLLFGYILSILVFVLEVIIWKYVK
nr:unnamed protein product [Callosobruchus analis]